jgi:hypothetical protein
LPKTRLSGRYTQKVQVSGQVRINNAITPATIGAIAGALLVILASSIPLIVLWGVGPVIVGSIIFATTSPSRKIKAWKAAIAVVLSIPAYLLAFFALAFTTSFAQSHGLRPSDSISDLGIDMSCGLAAAVLTACVEMEILSWFLSGLWSLRHAFLLMGSGLVVLAITCGIGMLAKKLVAHPSNTLELWVFFGPMLLLGGASVTAIVHDQVVQAQSIAP